MQPVLTSLFLSVATFLWISFRELYSNEVSSLSLFFPEVGIYIQLQFSRELKHEAQN